MAIERIYTNFVYSYKALVQKIKCFVYNYGKIYKEHIKRTKEKKVKSIFLTVPERDNTKYCNITYTTHHNMVETVTVIF